MRREPFVWVTALMAVALGLILAVRDAQAIMGAVLRRLAVLVNLPRPRAADWVDGVAPWVASLARWMDLLGVLALLLGIAFAIRCVRMLNPAASLRLGSAAPTPAGPWYRTPLDDRAAYRVAAGGLLSFYLLGGFRWFWETLVGTRVAPWGWGLTALAFVTPVSAVTGLALGFILGGALLWLVWGERGVLRRNTTVSPPVLTAAAPAEAAGESDETRSATRKPGSYAEIAARGAMAGLLALPLLIPMTEIGRFAPRALITVLSPSDALAWQWLAGGVLLWYPLALLAAVGLLEALGRPGVAAPERMRRLAFPTIVALVATVSASMVGSRLSGGRYDLTTPLEQALPGLRPIQERRAYLLFTQDRLAWSGRVPYGSIRGIAAGPDIQERVWAYLRDHHYETPQTENLLMHLYDAAAVEWDSTEILKVCLATMEGNPNPTFGRLLLEKLDHCQITPANRAMLDQMADPNRFRFEGTFARQTLAHFYRRFGDLDRARAYDAAVLSAAGTAAPVTDGVVSGRVLADGRPVPGLRVGLVRADQAGGLFGDVIPFEHRWIGAATLADDDGGFRITSVGEGSYLLVVMADDRRLRLSAEAVSVSSHPGLIRLDRAAPARELGAIDILVSSPPPPGAVRPPERPDPLPGQLGALPGLAPPFLIPHTATGRFSSRERMAASATASAARASSPVTRGGSPAITQRANSWISRV